MKINEANIDIIRKEGKLISVCVEMPFWDKMSDDNFISVNIPLFGIKTYSENDVDSDKAIEEAINLFCINSEKFGKGLEVELKLIGWSFSSQTEEGITSMSYSISNSNTVLDQIMQTGEKYIQKVNLAS